MPRWKKKKCPSCGITICNVSKTCRSCRVQSEETRAKMSKSQKGLSLGRKNSEATKKKMSLARRNENHPAWKGEKAGYIPIHIWVAKHKGKPNKCEHCGSTTAKKYEWANLDHSYKRNLDDYVRLCTSCHRKHDIENNGYLMPVKPCKT